MVMQVPVTQVPVEHSVPSAFGKSLPFLHFFPLFVFRHLPFLQVWHSIGPGLHLPDLAASASASPSALSAPPRSVPSDRRRVFSEPSTLAIPSNRVSSTGVPPDAGDETNRRRRWSDRI